MNVWIVSESDAVTARIRKALQKLDVECPLANIVSSMSVRTLAAESTCPISIVFYATDSVQAEDCEALRCLRSCTETKVVVVASVANHATVLKAIRAGAGDFLDADSDLDEEIAGLIGRLRAEGPRPLFEGRMIAVVPCHVSTDASVLSVNLAAVIARYTKSCCLLDFQFRGGDLAMLLKLDPRHTLYDLISQPEAVDEAMFQQALTSHDSGIQLLAGPPLFSDLAQIQAHLCQHIITFARRSFPYVIVNSEDILHAEQIRALASSNEIVLTMRLDVVSLHRAKLHVEYLHQNHVPDGSIHVVAIGTGHAGELPIGPVKKILGVDTVHCVPDDPIASIASANVGNPLVLESPTSKSATAITSIAAALSQIPEMVQETPKRWKLPSLRAASL